MTLSRPFGLSDSLIIEREVRTELLTENENMWITIESFTEMSLLVLYCSQKALSIAV